MCNGSNNINKHRISRSSVTCRDKRPKETEPTEEERNPRRAAAAAAFVGCPAFNQRLLVIGQPRVVIQCQGQFRVFRQTGWQPLGNMQVHTRRRQEEEARPFGIGTFYREQSRAEDGLNQTGDYYDKNGLLSPFNNVQHLFDECAGRVSYLTNWFLLLYVEEGKHPLNFNNVCKIVIEEVISYKITRNPFQLPTYLSIVNKYVLQICRQRGDIEITTFTHLPQTTDRYIIFNRVKEVFCRYLYTYYLYLSQK